MKENKKGAWAVIHFPNGKFNGKIELVIHGENLLSSECAKEIIDSMEKGLDKCCEEL